MFSCTTAQHIYSTNCTVCNWTVLTVITQKLLLLLLHVELHNSTAHLPYKLYSLQLNCTYNNYTEAAAAATCWAAQQHRDSEADVFWSAVLPVDWYCMFIYIQSYPEIKSFKVIHMTLDALPQPHSSTVDALPQSRNSTQHKPKVLSADCEAAFLSVCDDVIHDDGVIRQDGWGKRLNTDWYCRYDTRCPQPATFSVIYSPVSTATKHRCQGSFQTVPTSEVGVLWGNL